MTNWNRRKNIHKNKIKYYTCASKVQSTAQEKKGMKRLSHIFKSSRDTQNVPKIVGKRLWKDIITDGIISFSLI